MKKNSSRPSIYQTVTDRILSSLKVGIIPWEKSWKAPRFASGPFPRNFFTSKPYRGINVLLLWSSDYSSSFWVTFKQAQELKGNVRKGERGTSIVFYKQLPEHTKQEGEATTKTSVPRSFSVCLKWLVQPIAMKAIRSSGSSCACVFERSLRPVCAMATA
jgi:antirestriction protein ArdC